MTKDPGVSPRLEADKIRLAISRHGYAIVTVSGRESYLEICRELGEVTQIRDVIVSPDRAEPYTGYSYKPDEVPFHSDFPRVNIVGLYCETPDQTGGENLLIDCRHVLGQLTPQEIDCLARVHVPLPRSKAVHPLLSMAQDKLPHIYWLPVFVSRLLPELDPPLAAAVTQFDQVLLQCRKAHDYISVRLAAREALWFNNYVMLHGRDRLDLSSARHQVRAFICTPHNCS